MTDINPLNTSSPVSFNSVASNIALIHSTYVSANQSLCSTETSTLQYHAYNQINTSFEQILGEVEHLLLNA